MVTGTESNHEGVPALLSIMAHETEAPPANATQPEAERHAAAEPSGYKQENPATAGPGETRVNTSTPENKLGHLNPSAPGDTSTTPGTTGEK